ncbi:MAG: hypothetical protein K8S13_22575 [Desulfobacula sp.]|nr:hypothetical protein [Desulfobacula sp.]
MPQTSYSENFENNRYHPVHFRC